MYRYVALAALLVLANGAPAIAKGPTAVAEMRNAEGRLLGTLTLKQMPGGIKIKGQLAGLPPGPHAFHIHEKGECLPPFTTAGGHFNPTGHEHGRDNPNGAHLGDMMNVIAKEDGKARLNIFAKDVKIEALEGAPGLLDADGASLMLHEKADDYKTDPTGNAGPRIACGVIRRP